MEQTATRTLTQSAQTAKAIRTLLKEKWPTIKFSVTSDNFAGGNSVDVAWNLGPQTVKVDAVINGFQYGHFNGMEDIYEYSNRKNNIPQAKYVHSQRSYNTDEEIAMQKIGWRKPGYVDLHKEGKTLYHIVGRDICKAAGLEYQGLDMLVTDQQVFTRQIYSYGPNRLRDCVNQLLHGRDFMTGYHGVTVGYHAWDKDNGKDLGYFTEEEINRIGFKSDNTKIEKINNVFLAY